MQKKRVFIVGAGGFAIEVYNWFVSSASHRQGYEFAGFIDDYATQSRIIDRLGLNTDPVCTQLFTLDEYKYKDGDRLLLAIGMPEGKKEYVQALALPESAYLTFVHDSAIVGPNTTLGNGVIVGPMCMIESNITIGAFSSFNVYSFIAHDVKIGAFCSLAPRVSVLGGAMVGNESFIGASAVINIKRQVGDRAFVGMNSSVIHNVADDNKVYGVPAREYKK